MYHPPYFAWGPPRRSVICPRGGTEPDVLRSVSRGKPWLISDTADSRKLFLFNVESGMRVNMHAFQSPQTMRIGELRLDLHPRGSPSGKLVSFDACDDTHGCQLFVMRLNASTMSPS